MTAALIIAAILAGLSATFLGLIDAGRDIDGSLSRLEREASTLHRTTTDVINRAGPAEATTRPRNSLKKMIDTFGPTAERAIQESATPYLDGVAQWLGRRMDLVPAVETINKAFNDYLEQARRAQADARKSDSAATLAARMLDLSAEQMVQRIEDARDRTRQAVASAMNALQLITFISIGIAALVVGLTPDQYS
jgi:hypothetical protein